MPRNRFYHGPTSDHFDGELFFNPGHPSTDKRVADLLRWRVARGGERWPNSAPGRQVAPDARVDGLRITMVGHASLLIQAAGRNLLVDPVWSDRVSPVSWAGPRRVNAPGIAFEDLPPIDIVLLTHNHYDHMDLATLRRLWDRDRPHLVAPLGNDAVVARAHSEIVVETRDWGDTADLGGGVAARLTPARHWSARSLGDRRMALWCGFAITSSAGVIYLSGDTGYGDGTIFREVGRLFPEIDVAILPIGAYEPRWFMQNQHVNPGEAVQIMLDCGAKQALGMHWGTFPLSDEGRTAPKIALTTSLASRGIEPFRFLAMQPGDQWEGPQAPLLKA